MSDSVNTPAVRTIAPEASPRAVEQRPTASLVPYKRNARTHSKKQIAKIAHSITELGFNNPILVDENNVVLAGHGRLSAAKLLKLETVPVVCISGLTDAKKRAYVIADNRIAEDADWDKQMLRLEFLELQIEEPDFEPEVTGFDAPQIDLIMNAADDSSHDEADDITPALRAQPVSRQGDLWQLGPHRLLCGDATQAVSYERLLAGEQAQMVFTDPPYNVRVADIVGLGKVKHDEFVMASGEMSEGQFIAFLKTVMEQLAANSTDGSLHFVCMDWRHLFELLSAAREVYSEAKNLLVWNKTNAGMGSLYRSKHELIYLFKNGTGPHVNNVELGRHGRYRTNVLNYPGATALGATRQSDLALHPTTKPVTLVADLIEDCSKRGQLVLDAFSGSGTTLIAAERTGRRACALELDPRYVDVAIERYQQVFNVDAIHADTGETFASVQQQRSAAEQ